MFFRTRNIAITGTAVSCLSLLCGMFYSPLTVWLSALFWYLYKSISCFVLLAMLAFGFGISMVSCTMGMIVTMLAVVGLPLVITRLLVSAWKQRKT
jgi:hypothetical protein